MERLNLIFLGPPGAGKGTQADLLANQYGYIKVSTGDILREAVKNKTPLGKKAESYMKRGELVPDDIMLGLIEDTIKKIGNGFILDGFPRTLPQAKGLEEILKKNGLQIHKVIFIDVSDDVIIQRLSSRRVCPNCKATYNLISNPPKKDEICDQCGTNLIQRPDDNPDVIKTRLKVYRAHTQPLIDFYAMKNILIKIDGEGTPDEISNAIARALKDGHPQD